MWIAKAYGIEFLGKTEDEVFDLLMEYESEQKVPFDQMVDLFELEIVEQ